MPPLHTTGVEYRKGHSENPLSQEELEAKFVRLATPAVGPATVDIPDEQFVLVRLRDGNWGDHPITGPQTRRKYGHHQDGDVFLMAKEDVFMQNRAGELVLRMAIFQPVEERKITPPVQVKAETAPPEPMVEEVPEQNVPTIWREDEEEEPEPAGLDLQTLPGIGPARAKKLVEAGLETKEAILSAGIDGLTQIGLTASHSAKIIEHLSK